MTNDDCGVYAIKTPSGKWYIGSAVSFRRRWNGHRSQLMRGVHHCPGLQGAHDKYGMDALHFVKLAIVPREQLIATEQTFLDAHAGNLYNICPRADSRLGRPQVASTRAKIAAFQRGRTRSDETRKRMSAAQVGRTVSTTTRANISAAQRGRTQSEATRKKRADALRGTVHKDNKTGFSGVGPFRNKFRARWGHKHLGLFDTAEAAHAAVIAAMGLLDNA